VKIFKISAKRLFIEYWKTGLYREIGNCCPWGHYDSIDFGARDQIKRIMVKSGEKLFILMHHHQSEHWIVVAGTAKVTKGDKTF
jgi:mannose-6-phosphate isomerase-like protein (cupin superfamily)